MGETLKKILYVEDEADIHAVAEVALESVGGLEVMMCVPEESPHDMSLMTPVEMP